MTRAIARVSPTAIPQRVSNTDRTVPAPTSASSSVVKWIRLRDPVAPAVSVVRAAPAVPVVSAAQVALAEQVAPVALAVPVVPEVSVARVALAVPVVPVERVAPAAARAHAAAAPTDCPA